APNAKNVKQMLLDWCRAKTEPYEGVDIQNFSSSWKDGIAFCALVHRFFPEAFEYSILNPNKPRDNFQLAFSTAKMAGCPPLLDAEDLVRMQEPDWKCVYTYIQEFYRCLVEKGLVKTKKRP
uniref:Smoothelin a n=1 Tax=Oryzias melastigma TaxID=30732 RepID=A0A3B3CYI2_ORYME